MKIRKFRLWTQKRLYYLHTDYTFAVHLIPSNADKPMYKPPNHFFSLVCTSISRPMKKCASKHRKRLASPKPYGSFEIFVYCFTN